MSVSYSILEILKVVVSERKFYYFEVGKDEIKSISKKNWVNHKSLKHVYLNWLVNGHLNGSWGLEVLRCKKKKLKIKKKRTFLP